MTGLVMHTSARLRRGTAVRVNLELPDGPLSFSGRVAWSELHGRGSRTGGEFLRVPEAAVKALAKFLQGAERQGAGA